MKYFDVFGNEISQGEFVDYYSKMYYFFNDYKNEQSIEELIISDTDRQSEDYIRFLRWKVGDRGNGNLIVTQYGAKIECKDIKSIADDIDSSWDNLPAREIYERINRNGVANLGTVYSLALVYFISHGKCPIYDKFAEIAIDAIIEEHEYRKPKKYIEMPAKTDYDAVFSRYDKYIDKLCKVFKNQWVYNRKIDCALWTYGHLFR